MLFQTLDAERGEPMAKDKKPASLTEQQMARIIRAIYILERRRKEEALTGLPSHYRSHVMWDGGEHRGRTYSSVWLKIARFVLEHRLEPVLLIEAQFRKPSKIVLEPTGILSSDALFVYQEFTQYLDAHEPISFNHQKQVCRNAAADLYAATNWTDDEIMGSVLFDESLAMTPLFRYCMAKSLKIERVYTDYLHKAVLQYIPRKQLYDNVWGNFIPARFAQKAEQVYWDLVNRTTEVDDG